MAGPEPGWYPDPEEPAQARYWDGTAWTGHVHPLDQPQQAPHPAPAGGPPDRAAQPWTDVADDQAPIANPAVPGGVFTIAMIVMAVVGLAILLISTGRSDISPSGASPDAPAIQELPDVEPAARIVDPQAMETAGCRSVDPGDGTDRSHFDLDGASTEDDLYDVPLPAWGPHTPQVLPLFPGPASSPLDQRVLLHNLEHGAVVVWFDPDVLDQATVDRIGEWQTELLVGGFTSEAGSNLYVSPISPHLDVAPISLRAWGVAIDCPAWDSDAADAFVAQHYGSRGEAPEAMLGPYPEDGPLLDDPGS